jgi:transcriptional regulator with XRE-family HTH domain
MEQDATFGAFIRNERTKKGLTISKAATLAGVSWRYWKLMESGANVSLGILRKAAAVLDLTRVPIGGGIEVVRSEASVDAGALLDIVESFAARFMGLNEVVDRLRDLAVTAMVKVDPLLVSESVRALFAGHVQVTDDEGARLARAAHRLAKDAGIPEPVIETPPAHKVAARKRRKA